MLDIALVWGLTPGAGLLLKPVVEELAIELLAKEFKDDPDTLIFLEQVREHMQSVHQ